MSDGAHFGGIESMSGFCFVGNHKRHDGTPVVRTTFPKMTGVDGGQSTSSTPKDLSRIVVPPLCCPAPQIPASGLGNRGAPQYPQPHPPWTGHSLSTRD